MKRIFLGLIAVSALAFVPATVKADWDHGHHGHHGWHGDHGHHGHHHRSRYGGYRSCRPPVVVYRNAYPPYGYPYGYGGYGTSFYYSGPNASFGFGF